MVDRPHPLAVEVAAVAGRRRVAVQGGDHGAAQEGPQGRRLVAASDVEREQLQQVEDATGEAHHFAIAGGVQRVAVMVAVAQLEVVHVVRAEAR